MTQEWASGAALPLPADLPAMGANDRRGSSLHEPGRASQASLLSPTERGALKHPTWKRIVQTTRQIIFTHVVRFDWLKPGDRSDLWPTAKRMLERPLSKLSLGLSCWVVALGQGDCVCSSPQISSISEARQGHKDPEQLTKSLGGFCHFIANNFPAPWVLGYP